MYRRDSDDYSPETGFWEVIRDRSNPPRHAREPKRSRRARERPSAKLERLGKPRFQEFSQLRSRLELRDWLQFLEC
jgi:hypothetical protein